MTGFAVELEVPAPLITGKSHPKLAFFPFFRCSHFLKKIDLSIEIIAQPMKCSMEAGYKEIRCLDSMNVVATFNE